MCKKFSGKFHMIICECSYDRNWMKNKIHQYYHGRVDLVNGSQVIPINYYYIKQEKFGGNVS